MRRANTVIVGAGPVGLVTALALAQAGAEVTVLDAQASPIAAPHDMIYRWSTLPALDRLGVLADTADIGVATSRWCFHVLDTGEQLVFDLGLIAAEVPHPYNLHISRQQFSSVLLRHLSRYSNVSVEWGARVSEVAQDDGGVSVLYDSGDGPATARAGWVVGADGAHSVVRRSLGLGFTGLTWPDRLVSLDIAFDFSSLGYLPTTYQLDPRRGALVGQVDRAGIWRYVYGESRRSPADTIAERIPMALAGVLPAGVDPRPVSWAAHRVHERTADRLRVGRVLLAGDAAHVTNPTGGFGLAGGLDDAVVLADALWAVIAGGADSAVLDRYAADRERFFRTVASPLSSETMHLVFHADNPARLGAEIEHYRRILASPDRHREFLLLSRELEALPTV
jgi:3-(3-hydroxy-phenyl)propionate hydroxylase